MGAIFHPQVVCLLCDYIPAVFRTKPANALQFAKLVVPEKKDVLSRAALEELSKKYIVYGCDVTTQELDEVAKLSLKANEVKEYFETFAKGDFMKKHSIGRACMGPVNSLT